MTYRIRATLGSRLVLLHRPCAFSAFTTARRLRELGYLVQVTRTVEAA